MRVNISFKRFMGRGFGAFLVGSVKKTGIAKIYIDIDAMLNACSDPKYKDLKFKELFSETVTHEIYHAVEELFDKSFNHKRINTALRRVMEAKWKEDEAD